MKTLTTTMISLLLGVVTVTAPASAESASVLLQEGLYAEEIEGDLDAAIKIYEQVLAESQKARTTAALAMYRIGLCHLKKGQKAKAATHFQAITKEYQDNEQLVARAKEQLKKLGVAPDGGSRPDAEATLYERLPIDVIRFIGNKYGTICAEAGARKLYANSHLYYVTPDCMMYKGGMGY